jgi:hypothetical protein
VFPLTGNFILRYIAPMATRLTFRRKFSRAQIEWRMDALSLEFQRTPDQKLIRKLAALNRLLARMEGRTLYRKNFN